MHDPSFMALALIVSEKNDLNAKTPQKSVNCKKIEHRVELYSSRCRGDKIIMTTTTTTTPEKQFICVASQARQKYPLLSSNTPFYLEFW